MNERKKEQKERTKERQTERKTERKKDHSLTKPTTNPDRAGALHRGGLDIDVGEDAEISGGSESSPSISAPAVPSPVASFGKCYIDFASHADARRAFDCLRGVEVVMEDDAVSLFALDLLVCFARL